MKKALVIALAVGLAVTAAYSGPMGPVKPTMGRFGLEFEVASDRRDMEWSQNRVDKGRAENLYFLGRGTYGLTDKVELTVRLGGANMDNVDEVDGATPGESVFEGSSEFAWGVGLSGILYEAGTWNIAGTANYLAHSSHDGPITGNVPDATATNQDYDYTEWQIGLQIQGKYDQFLPYLGVKYSDATLDFNKIYGVTGVADSESDKNVGVYVGAGFDLTPQWSGYLEGRFVDETSFGGGIRYTF